MKVKFGLKNVYYAVKTVSSDGVVSYDTPVSIPGAVNLSLDPDGEVTKFYADDVVYYKTSANNGYTGDLEIALIPDSFLIDVMGFIEDENGAIIEDASAKPNDFALIYEVEGDEKARRAVLYNITAERTSTEAKTKEDKVEVSTEKISITATAREDNNYVKATIELTDSNETAYESFITSVYEPTIWSDHSSTEEDDTSTVVTMTVTEINSSTVEDVDEESVGNIG